MEYTPEQNGLVILKKRELLRMGRPEIVARIDMQIEAGVPFAELQFLDPTAQAPNEIRPQTSVDATQLETPPRSGKGATKAAWLDFALLTMDIDPDVLADSSRDDIIVMLEQAEIIPILEP
jgi:hypothetical protein